MSYTCRPRILYMSSIRDMYKHIDILCKDKRFKNRIKESSIIFL